MLRVCMLLKDTTLLGVFPVHYVVCMCWGRFLPIKETVVR